MKKPTYDLSSSKAQFRAESPKSGNLSTMPKRSQSERRRRSVGGEWRGGGDCYREDEARARCYE